MLSRNTRLASARSSVAQRRWHPHTHPPPQPLLPPPRTPLIVLWWRRWRWRWCASIWPSANTKPLSTRCRMNWFEARAHYRALKGCHRRRHQPATAVACCSPFSACLLCLAVPASFPSPVAAHQAHPDNHHSSSKVAGHQQVRGSQREELCTLPDAARHLCTVYV